jgi:hypothetical protein
VHDQDEQRQQLDGATAANSGQKRLCTARKLAEGQARGLGINSQLPVRNETPQSVCWLREHAA